MAEPVLDYLAASRGLTLPALGALLEVSECGPRTRLVLRAAEPIAARLSHAFGAPIANEHNRASAFGARASLRLGPDEWLLLAEAGAAGSLAAALADAAAGRPHALVDVSHRTAGFEVTGTRVSEVLASACPLPLDADRFPEDHCTRTVFGKAEILLWRRSESHVYLEAARSFVPYVIALLNVECSALRLEASSTRAIERKPRAAGSR